MTSSSAFDKLLLMSQSKIRVLILGAGFGGVKTALGLAGNEHFDVTIISEQDDFRYYPTLYHAAIGGNVLASIIPLEEIFAGKDVTLVKGTAKKLDRVSKKVALSSGKYYSYDVLVVALGVVTNYFGIKGLNKYSYGIKTLNDAQELRDHLHKSMVDESSSELNYVVIGGGPTGVELAGSLPTYLAHVAKSHKLPKKTIHVDLVEAQPRLMPTLSKHYSHAVQKQLRRLGVKLYLNQKVEAETADGLMVSGHNIKSHTVVWTAGVTNNPFLAANKFTLNERGKALVNELLQAEEDIYIIGDNAQTQYSGMAQTALHDAIFLTDNLKRLSTGQRPTPYKPRRPVYITPAGSRWAAVQWGHLQVYGRLGWALREVADLIGYHDLEPWWFATEHWMASNASSEPCMVCSKGR